MDKKKDINLKDFTLEKMRQRAEISVEQIMDHLVLIPKKWGNYHGDGGSQEGIYSVGNYYVCTFNKEEARRIVNDIRYITKKVLNE